MHQQLNGKNLKLEDQEILIKNTANESLFYFSKNILGYDKLSHENEKWCWELEQHLREDRYRTLSLAPRVTYKTTVRTKAYPLWRLTKNHNLRILIVNETENNARKFLREIKGHCERNKYFIHFYGQWMSEKWAEKEIVIAPRTVNYSEASITAMGFGSTLTSAHYDIIIVDDPVGMNDRESEAIRRKKEEWFRELPSILMDNGEIHIVGTRWHYDDLYHDIINKLNPELKSEGKKTYFINCQPALDKDGNSNFPDILPLSKLKQKEIEVGAILYAANYLNDPLSEGSKIFRLEDLQYYNHLQFEQEYVNTRKHIDYYGFIDPSLGKGTSDYVAIIIAAVPKDGYIRIVEAKIVLIPPTRQIRTIADLQERYNFKKFGVEENMFRGLLKKEIEDLSAKEKTYIKLQKITQTKNKRARIEASEPQIKRYVRFRDDWNTAYPKLINQLTRFPVTTHDDGPDALEGLVSLIKGKGKPQIY